MINLKFEMNAPHLFDMDDFWKQHPVDILNKLGITYERSQPMPIADCWIFYNCNNVDESKLSDALLIIGNS